MNPKRSIQILFSTDINLRVQADGNENIYRQDQTSVIDSKKR